VWQSRKTGRTPQPAQEKAEADELWARGEKQES
jgi:hypothetical protein